MLTVKLVGAPNCRRYQRMREGVVREAKRLGITIHMEEIGDTESLSKTNPLSLPRLYIGGELIASQNPPKTQDITRALQSQETNHAHRKV